MDRKAKLVAWSIAFENTEEARRKYEQEFRKRHQPENNSSMGAAFSDNREYQRASSWKWASCNSQRRRLPNSGLGSHQWESQHFCAWHCCREWNIKIKCPKVHEKDEIASIQIHNGSGIDKRRWWPTITILWANTLESPRKWELPQANHLFRRGYLPCKWERE